MRLSSVSFSDMLGNFPEIMFVYMDNLVTLMVVPLYHYILGNQILLLVLQVLVDPGILFLKIKH